MKTRRKLLSGVFYAIILLLVMIIGGAVTYMIRAGGGTLPVSGQAPNFTATNINGKSFHFSDLKGKIRLITWFYTRCPDACPLTAYRMSQIQDHLEKMGDFGSKVAFVSMSINPQYDILSVIKKWSEHYHANYNGWYFVNAAPSQTNAILKNWGIQAKVSDDPEKIEHILKTELVDGDGNIRAIYTSEDLNVNLIESDIQSLISQGSWRL